MRVAIPGASMHYSSLFYCYFFRSHTGMSFDLCGIMICDCEHAIHQTKIKALFLVLRKQQVFGTELCSHRLHVRKMLCVFRHTEKNRLPTQHDIADFCTLVDEELHENPEFDVQVIDLTHYKEKVDAFTF